MAVPQLSTSIIDGVAVSSASFANASCNMRTSSGESSPIGNSGIPARACKISRRLAIDLERGREMVNGIVNIRK